MPFRQYEGVVWLNIVFNFDLAEQHIRPWQRIG
jgi:hypothetical protein